MAGGCQLTGKCLLAYSAVRMNEYMLRVLNRADHQAAWSVERHREFVKRCEVYIQSLQRKGQLDSAQPLAKQGAVLSKAGADWHIAPLDASHEIQVGYYHVRAGNLQDAIEIAKGNPEFEYSTTARVEVRPLKASEETTGFVYPR